MLVWSPTIVLEVRKVITMFEECCPWYFFTAKQVEMAKILLRILRKAAAKSVILGCKNQRTQNPRGTRANAVPFYLCCHFVGTTVMFCIAIRKLNIGNDKLLFVSVCMSAAGGWSWAQSRTVLHCQPGHHLWKRSLSSHSPQQGLAARSEMEARHFLDLRKREREGEKTQINS